MKNERKMVNLEDVRLIEIFKQSPISIELYDKNGFLLEVNQACVDLFGLSNNIEIKGFNLFSNPHLTPQGILDIKAGKPIKYELEYNFDLIREKNLYKTTRQGKCYLECFINPTVDSNKEITGYIVHINEISERKQAEMLLEKQAKELQELNATKDKFMSIIAHDLRSPFNAIIGFSDLMVKNFHQLDEETFLKGLKIIESASNHAYKLLENLLIWARNQTEKSQFSPEMLNLSQLVHEALKTIESTAVHKNISFSTSINKNQQVFADRNMLDSIIRNLVTNAIKFSFKEGKVRIKAILTENGVCISVSDKGIGISSERLASIFEIDKHTNTNGTENELGSGLGLILCKDFVTRHNGEIWIESTLNKGTKVSFTLPLKSGTSENQELCVNTSLLII